MWNILEKFAILKLLVIVPVLLSSIKYDSPAPFMQYTALVALSDAGEFPPPNPFRFCRLGRFMFRLCAGYISYATTCHNTAVHASCSSQNIK